MRFSVIRFLILAGTALFVSPASTILAQTVTGGNFGAPTTVINVPYGPGAGNSVYSVGERIIFDPTAGLLEKHFASPHNQSGQPLPIDAASATPLLISEEFTIVNQGTPTPRTVSDWHEAILTKGWTWYLPTDPGSSAWFPEGTTLIDRDLQPWNSSVVPTSNPLLLNIDFDPITPGHFLSVHKALLWVGNGANTVWGDDPDETFIEVREYPTPEPGTIVLSAVGAVLLLLGRVRPLR